MKRPASTEKEDKEVKKVKLELTKNQITKKEVKSDEDDGTTSEIKKHLKKLTREVSFISFFLNIFFSLQLTSTSQVLQIVVLNQIKLDSSCRGYAVNLDVFYKKPERPRSHFAHARLE